jgi:hypothetical protein
MSDYPFGLILLFLEKHINEPLLVQLVGLYAQVPKRLRGPPAERLFGGSNPSLR